VPDDLITAILTAETRLTVPEAEYVSRVLRRKLCFYRRPEAVDGKAILDPEPWVDLSNGKRQFAPREGFSQKEEDYAA